MPEVRVLNVAEKPSVARALVSVFASMQGSRESRPMRREAAQIFEHQNVRFPKIWLQGRGQVIQGPGKPWFLFYLIHCIVGSLVI